VGLTAQNAREIVEIRSPSIGDEHGIFTCLISFPNK